MPQKRADAVCSTPEKPEKTVSFNTLFIVDCLGKQVWAKSYPRGLKPTK